ncbi:MAG: serine/threonine-protein phosphatase [Marinospirillum sp.]|uniref:PP2C family protein-serine/threonine phosphatase n=1 Tax=Marinospirillum sp. TaxID=2183934 RepID=UPI0019D8F13F|nr:protein phosphatase 2C domain-containing protein [Marinospirillum sp.]MBE0506141.1 serine/threonine-protein phosphatase [Marinospirillum sp.]
MTLQDKKQTGTIAISAGLTDRGHVRQVNEDAFLEVPEKGLWLVADGMGGHDAGDVASSMIVETLRGTPVNGSLSDRLDQIEDALDQINNRLLERSQSDDGKKHIIGSTLAMLVIENNRMGVLLWAGDSRIYRLRNGNLVQMSSDHSQVETYIRQGLITREEAKKHPERHIITRAVGSQEELYMEADLCELSSGDRYLLCSDGLTRHLDDPEIADYLKQGSPEEICKKLVDLTLDRGARDNVTVVVVEII